MPSTRSLCGIVNTSSVGRFGVNGMPLRLVERPLTQTWPVGRPIVSVGARPAVSQRAVLPRVQIIAARGEIGEVRLPCRDRIGPIEPAQPRDRLPQPRDLLSAADSPERPAPPSRRRGGDDRPVRLVPRDVLAERPHARAIACCTAPTRSAGCVLQQIGIVGVDRQHRMASLDMLHQRVAAARRRTRSNESRGACLNRASCSASSPHSVSTSGAPARYALAAMCADQRRRVERRAAVGERTDDQESLAGCRLRPTRTARSA